MADIVTFKPSETSARDVCAEERQQKCEIILFPGVRYERWGAEVSPSPRLAPKSRKSRTKRRELEMAD